MLIDIIIYLGIFLILATLIPLIRHDFWIFRVFEYPRLQKLSLNVVLIGLLAYSGQPFTTGLQLLALGLFFNLLYLVYQVYPFTVFGRQQIISSRKPAGENNIGLFIANVYQENRESAAYLKEIKKCNPDVVLMVETNKWWDNALQSIEKDYPFQLKAPLENTYGLLFYSRLPIHNGSVNYLVEDDIPSVEVDVELPSGQRVKLYCLHPTPPVPQENPRSTERDKEILMVAEKAKECKIPVIVMGDLNDVAWSYTTELFGKISGLLDPRRGRGFYNSFNAKYPFLRFPLDHIFCSTDFSLTTLQRLPRCGSDHFPICVNLQYDPVAEEQNEEPKATAEDKAIAEEKINADTSGS